MGYSDSKPECYGDADYYDPTDHACAECAVNQSCGIRASRASGSSRSAVRGTSRRYETSIVQRSNKATTPARRTVNARLEEAPHESSTFAHILLHNTGLEVLQSVVDELSSSIRHIPRLDYGRYFERKKK